MPVRVVHDQSGDDYHNEKFHLSSTNIKCALLRSLLHMEQADPTINKYIADEGNGVHLVFEGKPEKVIQSGETRRGKQWEQDQKRAAAMGGVALPAKVYAAVMGAGTSARNHPTIGQWLRKEECWHEASIFAEHTPTGQGIKCKPDVYIPRTGSIIDLKTTVSADPRDFIRSCFKYAYDVQGAFYRMVCREAGLLVSPNFHILAVEKTKPFAAQHFVLEDDVLSAAEERVEQVMLEIAQSRETGVFTTGWPAVSKINSSIREKYNGF